MSFILVVIGMLFGVAPAPRNVQTATACWHVDLEQTVSEDDAAELGEQLMTRASYLGGSGDYLIKEGQIVLGLSNIAPVDFGIMNTTLIRPGELAIARVIADGQGAVPPDYAGKVIADVQQGTWIVPGVSIDMGAAPIEAVFVTEDYSMHPAVNLRLTPYASRAFGAFTTAALNGRTESWEDGHLLVQQSKPRIAIMIDGKVMSAPQLMSPIQGGVVSLSGLQSEEEVRNLAALLAAGPLKAQVEAMTGPVPCGAD